MVQELPHRLKYRSFGSLMPAFEYKINEQTVLKLEDKNEASMTQAFFDDLVPIFISLISIKCQDNIRR